MENDGIFGFEDGHRYHYTGEGQARISRQLKKHETAIIAAAIRENPLDLIAAGQGVSWEAIRRRVAAVGLTRRRGRPKNRA